MSCSHLRIEVHASCAHSSCEDHGRRRKSIITMSKLGKNEAKKIAAAKRAELDEEMDEEERKRMLNAGMGIGGGLHKGDEKLFEKKLTKEEKKLAAAARKAERLAAKAERASGERASNASEEGGEEAAAAASAAAPPKPAAKPPKGKGRYAEYIQKHGAGLLRYVCESPSNTCNGYIEVVTGAAPAMPAMRAGDCAAASAAAASRLSRPRYDAAARVEAFGGIRAEGIAPRVRASWSRPYPAGAAAATSASRPKV